MTRPTLLAGLVALALPLTAVAQDSLTQRAVLGLPNLDPGLQGLLGAFGELAPWADGHSPGGRAPQFGYLTVDGGRPDEWAAGARPLGGSAAGAAGLPLEAIRSLRYDPMPLGAGSRGYLGGRVRVRTAAGGSSPQAGLAVFTAPEAWAREGDTYNRSVSGLVSGPAFGGGLRFFLAGSLRDRPNQFQGLSADSAGTGVSSVTADRVTATMSQVYGVEAGDHTVPDLGSPHFSVYLRASLLSRGESRWEFTQRLERARRDFLTRSPVVLRPGARPVEGGFQLSRSGYQEAASLWDSRLTWYAPTSSRYRVSASLDYTRRRERRESHFDAPLIFVAGDAPGAWIATGTERSAQGQSLDQDALELTVDLVALRGSHSFSAGLSAGLLDFGRLDRPGSSGVWSFLSADSLAQGIAASYEQTLAGEHSAGQADFGARRVGIWLEDSWSLPAGVELMVGVRADVTALDRPGRNDQLRTELGIDTSNRPLAGLRWSPRAELSLDAGERGLTLIRGGVASVTSELPYAWVASTWLDRGFGVPSVTCDDDLTPPFETDPSAQPAGCGVPAAEERVASFFDDDFRFPRVLVAGGSVSQKLGAGFTGTVRAAWTWSRDQVYVSDANLAGVQGISSGEGDRRLYGIAVGSDVLPVRRSTNFGAALRHSNSSQDRARAASVVLSRSTGKVFVLAGYTYTRAEDVLLLAGATPGEIVGGTPLDGNHDARSLRTSGFERRHRVALAAVLDLPLRFNLGVTLTARSGTPYGYVVDGDVNGDGFDRNDLVYVPVSQTDITLADPADWAELDARIVSDPCLNSQRGRILQRNSCRNPWSGLLSVRIGKTLGLAGRNLEALLDIVNLPNLVHADWGLERVTSAGEGVPLLAASGYDGPNGRYSYVLALPERNSIVNESSRWRMQLGIRYGF